MTPRGSEARRGAPTGTRGTDATSGGGPPSLHAAPGATAWRVRGGVLLPWTHPLVMGVVNLTPDSFFDGGCYRDVAHALEVAEAMAAAGAGIIDVGGESTRPGARPVSVAEELDRVLGFVEEASDRLPIPLSIDTRKAEVARAAFAAGVAVVNDVSGLAHDPGMASAVAEAGAGVVLMHMRGDPIDMADHATYTDVENTVASELGRALARALAAGIAEEAIVLDPGIGFAKTARHSLELLANLDPIRRLGFPLLVGPSRKSFIGAVTGAATDKRLAGTLAACVAAYLQGARIFRVHDVEPVVQALAVAEAIVQARRSEWEEAAPL